MRRWVDIGSPKTIDLTPTVETKAGGSGLVDKVAVVTGGGTGIGRAVALAFAAQGATVFILGRRLGPLQEVVRSHQVKSMRRIRTDFKKQTGIDTGSITPVSCDVSDFDAVKKAFEEIAATRNGQIDILVNSAGVNIAERHSNVSFFELVFFFFA